MTAYDIQAWDKRKFVVTTDSKYYFPIPIAPNLLQGNFTMTAQNQVWMGDITYIQTDEGWFYLTDKSLVLVCRNTCAIA